MRRTSMAILSMRAARHALSYCRSFFELPTVERKFISEFLDFAAHIGHRILGRDIAQHLGDEGRRLAHFRFPETARSDRRASQPDAARVKRRIHIERDGVLVDRDARTIER